MFSFFRKAQRSVWPVDEQGRTELHLAAMLGDYKTLKRLFKEGAGTILHAIDRQGNTALHLVAQGVDGIPEQYEQGEKDPVWYATKVKAYEKTLALLLQQSVYLNAPNHAGETPLHLAVRISRQVPLIDALIAAGAAVDVTDAQGNTVLHLAVSIQKAAFNILQYLLRYSRIQHLINHKNTYEQAPLHLVVTKEPYPDQALVFKTLLEAGAAVDVPNLELETSLHLAAWRGDRDMIKALLTKTNNINALDLEGNTPLYKAFLAAFREGYDLTVIELLLQAGANPDQTNYRLQTSRQLAQSIPRLRLLLVQFPEVKPIISLQQKEQLIQSLVDIMQRQTHLSRLYAQLKTATLSTTLSDELNQLAKRYCEWFPILWKNWQTQSLPEVRQIQADRDIARQTFQTIQQKLQVLEEQLRQHRALWDLTQDQNARAESERFLIDKIKQLEPQVKIQQDLQNFYLVLLAQWPYFLQRTYLQQQWQEAFGVDKAENEFEQRFNVKKILSIDEQQPETPVTIALSSITISQKIKEERPMFTLIKEQLSKRYQTLRPKGDSFIVADSLQVLLDDWYMPRQSTQNYINDNNSSEGAPANDFNVQEMIEAENEQGRLLFAEQNSLKQQIIDLRQQLALQQQNQNLTMLLHGQLEEMQAQQKLLWNEYAVKMDYKEGLKRFQEHPNLFLYYRTVQIKLEEIFIGFKTVASGLVDPAEGQLAAAKSIVEFFGDFASIIPFIGPAIEKITKWGAGKVIKAVDQARGKNAAINVSDLVTLSEVKKTAERTARALTLRYEEQLKRLITPEQEAKICGQFQKGLIKVKTAITLSKSLPAAKQMAAFAVLTMMEALQSGSIREDRPIDEQLVARVTKSSANIKLVWSLLSEPLNLAPLMTVHHKQWLVSDVYHRPGIKVLGETGAFEYYQGEEAEPDTYGWRIGTLEEVRASKWQLVEAPVIQNGLEILFQPTYANPTFKNS